MKWKRFHEWEETRYFYMSEEDWDAVQFQPKNDIYFRGFGVMNGHEKKPFKFIFKYNIEGTDSAEYEVDFT